MKSKKTKVCSCCHKRKSKKEYYKYAAAPDGLGYYCKPCAYQKRKEWIDANKEHCEQMAKEYRQKNKIKIAAYQELYYAKPKNAKRQSAYQKKYRETHKKELARNSKKYYERNKELCRNKALKAYYKRKQSK